MAYISEINSLQNALLKQKQAKWLIPIGIIGNRVILQPNEKFHCNFVAMHHSEGNVPTQWCLN